MSETTVLRIPMRNKITNEEQAMELARQTCVDGARQVNREFTKPDDDWAPVVFIVGSDEGMIVSGNGDKHDLIADATVLVGRVQAFAVAHLHSSWSVILDPRVIGYDRAYEINLQVDRQGGSTEGIPEREEVLGLTVHGRSMWVMYQAKITRHDDAPPTLEPWVTVMTSDSEVMKMGGGMFTPLREALEAIA